MHKSVRPKEEAEVMASALIMEIAAFNGRTTYLQSEDDQTEVSLGRDFKPRILINKVLKLLGQADPLQYQRLSENIEKSLSGIDWLHSCRQLLCEPSFMEDRTCKRWQLV